MTGRKIFCFVAAIIVTLAITCMAACSSKKKEWGAEAGVYNLDEYSLVLGDEAVLFYKGEVKRGGYRLDGKSLFIDFDDGTVEAEYNDMYIDISLDEELTFYRSVMHTVTFFDGESELKSVEVLGGNYVPEFFPTKDGYEFLGWFRDAEPTEPFSFTERIKGGVSLYAQWAKIGDEFTIDFDLGYDATMPSMRTTGGKLLGLTEPTRSGYIFAGWWISMYNERSKLSYAFTADTEFVESTTLFALWRASGVPAAPDVSVFEHKIEWTGAIGATYSIVISNESGEVRRVPVQSSGGLEFDFSTHPLGDYKVVVTGTVGGVSAVTERYYRNKALSRITLFKVNGNVLEFLGVANAERYVLSVECGNENHSHAAVDLGKRHTYDFSSCPVGKDGIRFTVTAYALGYMPSLPFTFVYNRVLGSVNAWVNEETKSLCWDRVENADGYTLNITCALGHKHAESTTETTYSLKECLGEIVAEICPFASGYNSPEPTVIRYTQKTPSAPRGLAIDGNKLVWTGDSTQYVVEIDGESFDVSAAEYDLSSLVARQSDGVHRARVKGADTAWSDTFAFTIGEMNGLFYEGGVLSWLPLVGAESYTVSVGGLQVTADGTQCAIELTRPGDNEVTVMPDLPGIPEARIFVFAHTVFLDSMGGEPFEPIYLATGDMLDLPTPHSETGDFGGWYDVPSGAAGNGTLYSSGIYTRNGDLQLYAYWLPRKITLALDAQGGEGETSADVYLDREYTLPVPLMKDRSMVFVGWYVGEDVAATRLTDERGFGLSPWRILPEPDSQIRLYARYVRALEFVKDTNGYSVKEGSEISNVRHLIIPETYIDLSDDSTHTVRAVDGFEGCTTLETIDIPSSVAVISTGSGTFGGCTGLREVNIYPAKGAAGPYSSNGGVLIREISDGFEIDFYPQNRPNRYVIPSNVTSVRPGVFEGRNISDVTVPASVTLIGGGAFKNCAFLTSVKFLAGDKPLDIEVKAFESCGSLTQITLPARTRKVGARAFYLCPLTEIAVAPGAKNVSSIDGVLVEKGRLVCYPIGKGTSYEVPAGITVIGDYAFEGSRLSEISLGTVTEIGEYAFAGVPLAKITLPRSVGKVGAYAFSDCTALADMTIENGLDSIEGHAFDGAKLSCELTDGNLQLPASLTSIGESAFFGCKFTGVLFTGDLLGEIGVSAFSGCSALKAIALPKKITDIKERTFSDCSALMTFGSSPLTSVGKEAFANCMVLKSEIVFSSDASKNGTIGNRAFAKCNRLEVITLDAAIKTIDRAAFEDCGNLTEVVLSDSLTTIGEYAFRRCNRLTTITIGSGVRSIGTSAFDSCTRLSEVIYHGTESDWSRISILDSTIKSVPRTYKE